MLRLTRDILAVLFGFAILVFAVYGYILNIVHIVNDSIWPMSGMMLVRIIGVFLMPLGAVVGYF